MGRESREVWAKRVERWRDSGLTAKGFASEIGVNANSLQNWGWRLGAERRRGERQVGHSPQQQAQPLQFVEVAPPTKDPPSETPPPFEIVLAGGAMVRVPTRFESDALRRLLAVMG